MQPRSQGLRGETVMMTLVKFVLSFQNFGKKIACAVRHNRIQPLLQYGCVALRMRLFSQNFGTIKRILPGSSSPSHREGRGTEVVGNADCPPFWYSKFVISGSFSLPYWMRDLGLFISIVVLTV